VSELLVAVVDDELIGRRRLARLAAETPAVKVVAECDSGEAALARVSHGGIEVLLLDIQMGAVSGLDVLGRLGGGLPLVVFVTAHAEHAVQAFDGGAVDYVLKPIDPARLARALLRARERVEAYRARALPAEPLAEPDPSGPLRLAIPTRRGLKVIDPGSVRYAIVDGESVLIHTVEGVLVTDFRLVALEKKLPADRFVRAHRRVLLNLEHVVGLHAEGPSLHLAELSDGATVPISRQAARALRRRWSAG
jgi:two-component system LytT family response regulator